METAIGFAIKILVIPYNFSTVPGEIYMLRLYIICLRANYQYALLENRKKNGEYLKEQITKLEKIIDIE
jgi:hypothetical protein